ncbi:ankyrin repeat-containing domain protein [Xylaria grammica]|nr:ankyrin repeat-containing domain protein [Xylaria grammica]
MWKSVRDKMDSASPTASASTNRGGRPKDWTEPRTRRLIRLYLFTTLPFPKILELLEEDEFKPGKDAANKVKNSVLGNDPRWIRPKDEKEEQTRIRGLRNSLRGRRGRQDTASHDLNGAAPEHSMGFGTFLEDRSYEGTTIARSYRSSIEELDRPDSASFAYSGANTDMFTMAPHDVNSSRFMPSLIGRLTTSRQDTGLTTSTDISITSALREKLSFLSIDRAKRTVKVLKRYTFPKNLDSQRSPNVSSGPFQGPEFYSPADRIGGLSNATYAIPGDFLNAELFAHQRRCASESPAHAAGVCWCKVNDQVFETRIMWDGLEVPSNISDPALMKKDLFGNTMFHRLAAMEGIQDLFFYLVCQALRDPYLPIRDSNSAGQTFLHALHRSWFQEGSKLTDLLDVLRSDNFDIFAIDVYGRNFYHNLRANRSNSARFPGHSADINRMNRRDAFGMKPMDMWSSPDANYAAAHIQGTQGVNTKTQAGFTRPVPRINTQAGTVEDKELLLHTDLLKVVLTAVGVDEDFSPDARNEDSQGRNGFHCLAEVDFCLSPGTPKPGSRGHLKDDSKPSPQGYNKRKHNEAEEVELPRTAVESRRLQCVEGLINAKVDANQYDRQGNTPLMSFVINSSDATKYDKEECESILRALVQKAGARLELRNRHGETALHLAARHGKTVALRVLLELGANPHTRNSQGLGILEVLDNLYVTTERDDKNNARFEACRAILTRTKDYAKQSPTLLDEWGV